MMKRSDRKKRERERERETAGNNGSLPYEIDFEAQKEDALAALRLSYFKSETLDKETIRELGDLKNKYLLGRRSQRKVDDGKKPSKDDDDDDDGHDQRTDHQNSENNVNIVYRCPESAGIGADGLMLSEKPPIERLEEIIGRCSKPFEKQLNESDLAKSQNRLKFNNEYVKTELIPMLKAEENLVNGINVSVYNSVGKKYSMVFKCWGLKAHILNGEWNNFLADYRRPLAANMIG